jgi:ribosome recycling factor
VKLAKNVAENARVSIRNARRDANEHIKNTVKSKSLPEDSRFEAEERIQKLTDSYIHQVEELFKHKEKDILTV